MFFKNIKHLLQNETIKQVLPSGRNQWLVYLCCLLVFAGFSSGANVAAALQLLAGEMAGKTVAVVICDSGLKYLSTPLWA